jgi:hypothetical protein
MERTEYMRDYMRKKRAARRGDVNTGDVNTESVSREVNSEVNMTETDAKFEEAKPGYYIFERKVPWDRVCWGCGERYATRLELNKFCSPQCKRQYLVGAFKT